MKHQFEQLDPYSPKEGSVPRAQCQVSGEWVPADELVSFLGKRVSAAGKRILLDRLSGGESPVDGSANIVAIARAQRWLIQLVLMFICGIFMVAVIAGISGAKAPILVVFVLGYIVMAVLYLIALYRLARACGSGWAWMYVVAQFLSIFGLIALIVLISKSNRRLRDAGLRVGLLGVKKSEIEAMATQVR